MEYRTYSQHLDWLLTMARTPGWKAYAWDRAKQMQADTAGLWPGIADEVAKRMKTQSGQDDLPGHADP